MKPHAKINSRPESARTQDTKLTLQSEANISTFSETDAFAVRKKTEDEPLDFGQHVEQLDRQKRFKHLAGLATIPEKKENEELKNQTCKPFEGRRSSNAKKTEKVDNGRAQKPVLTAKSSKQDIAEEANSSTNKGATGLQKSNNFLEKSISKMNGLVVGSKETKPQQPRQLPLLESNPQEQESVRLNFAAFVANDPVKRRQQQALKATQEKKSPEKPAPTKEKAKSDPKSEQLEKIMTQLRQRKLRNAQLSQYVSERELRNMDSFPKGYEAAIESMSNRQITEHNAEELSQLDVSTYNAGEFGDRDIVTAMRKIRELDQRIDKAENHPEEQTKEQDDLEYSQDSEHPGLTANSLTLLKRNNNLFLTEIMKNGGSQHDIEALLNMERSHIKMTKLEQEEEQESSSDSEQVKPRINNRIIERNRIQAAGELFQECDFLSEEHKKRLAELMADIESGREDTTTPFDLTQEQSLHLRGLDQGLSVYQSLFGSGPSSQPVIYEQNLPKDPVLRKQSEVKILRDKISAVNSGLRNVRNIPVDRFKIQSMIERLQDMGIQQAPSAIINQTRRQFEEVSRKVQESEQFLQAGTDSRAQILNSLQQIRERFVSLETELLKLNQMSDQEVRQLQLTELEQRRSRLAQYQQRESSLQEGLRVLEDYSGSLRIRLRQLDSLDDEVELPSIDLSSLNLHETLQELDSRLGKLAATHQS